MPALSPSFPPPPYATPIYREVCPHCHPCTSTPTSILPSSFPSCPVLPCLSQVDAFVYSPLLDAPLRGTSFDHLFHVTDWFPTLLEIAAVPFKERDG